MTGPSQQALALNRRELLPWALSGIALGLVEGAAAAVLVKTVFAGRVAPDVLNLAAAFVSGSPAMANMTSFLWANLAHGREKVRLLVWLMAAFGLVVTVIGVMPRGSAGLALTVLSVLVARSIWSGILTVRAAVWSANYPRNAVARITGRIVVLTSLGMAATAAMAGMLLSASPQHSMLLYIVAGAAALLAAWFSQRMRVRRAFQLRAAEQGASGRADVFSLASFRRILASDPDYRRFMLWMAVYGAGNLMVTGQLVILFTDRLQLPAAQQVAVLTIVPLLCMPLFTPMWARMFDAGHVVQFRARQCWVVVAAIATVIVAVFLRNHWLLWCSAVLFGVSTAGANLGWNLGHNDFASLGKVQQYMGVHVTLTGMRGLLAPPLGAVIYTLLERWAPGAGRYALLLPLAMCLAGAIGFTRMKLSGTGLART
jgi:hypothetical protein